MGAALPLLALGLLSRETLMSVRESSQVPGLPASSCSVRCFSFPECSFWQGVDKIVEAKLLEISPDLADAPHDFDLAHDGLCCLGRPPVRSRPRQLHRR